MKKVIISLIIAFTFNAFNSWAQCDESIRRQALQEMGNSQYIKDFSVNLQKGPQQVNTGQMKFNVLLNSRNHYRFNVVNGNSNPTDIVMQLYDQDELIVSNRHEGKTYSNYEIVIRTTKVYQLVFSFPGGHEGCAEAVLSLVKQYTADEMPF